MFVLGSTLHYAMARHVLGVKKFPPGEEVLVDQFVDLILGGLEKQANMEPGRAPGRIAKGTKK